MNESNLRLLEAYLDHLIARNKSSRTVKTFRSLLISFLEYLGDKDLETATQRDIDGFLASLRRKGAKDGTIYNAAVAVKRFFEYIEVEKPLKGFELPKRRRSLPRFLSEREVEALINSCSGTTERLIVSLLYTTGVRVSELVNIRVRDIDLSSQTIRVVGKGGKERIVFFNDEVRELIELHIKANMLDEEDYLLKSSRGNKMDYTTVERRLKQIARRAGIRKKVTPHVLRHTFATHMLKRGINIRVLQELLGHSKLSTTQVYTHVTPEIMKNEYDKAWRKLTCPNCGNDVYGNASRCPYCGSPMQTPALATWR